MSNPISFGAFLGDWARYIPRQTSQARIMLAVIGAQLATLVPFLFGLATATIVAVRALDYIAANNYVGGLLAIAPGWFFLPVCPIAVIGGMSTGTTSPYGTGLDMSSVFPRLLAGAGHGADRGRLDRLHLRRPLRLQPGAERSTFAVLIVTCTTPWMVIMLIGLLTRRGFYRPDDLQVFTRGQRGGALLVRARLELARNGRLDSQRGSRPGRQPAGQFVGPLGELAGGIDLSLPVALGLAALLYLALLRLFPEPPCVYGPQGPRWVRRARHAEGPCDSHRLRRVTHTAGRQCPALPAPRRIQQ